MYTTIIKALQAESIKARHTKTIWQLVILASIIPLLLAFLQILGVEKMGGNIDTAPTNFADFINKIASIFSLLFYPMGIVLIAAQVSSVEHKNSTWQLIETQPIPKWAIYTAKFLRTVWGMIKFVLLFYIISYAVFYIIYLLSESGNPSYYFKIEIGDVILRALSMVLSGMAYAALFFVLNILFKRTSLITAIGIVSIIGYMIANGFQYDFPRWFPLLHLGVSAGEKSTIGEWISYYSRISVVVAIVILILGYTFYAFKTHRHFFFKNKKGLLTHIAILILGIGIIYLVQRPRYQQSHGTSIVTGIIDTDIDVTQLVMKDLNTQSVVATIPVDSKGVFHINLSNIHLPKQRYYFSLNNSGLPLENSNYENTSNFFMTDGDSIYVNISYKNNFADIRFSGDRRAEATLGIATSPQSLLNLMNFMNFQRTKSMTIDYAMERFSEYYNNDIKNISKKVTLDGLKIGEDVQNFQTNLLKVFYLQAWSNITKEHFPEDADKEFDLITEIKSSITSDDEDLWMVKEFLDYQLTILNNGKEVNQENMFEVIQKILNEHGRSHAYALAIENALTSQENDDSNAVAIYDKYIQHVTSPFVKEKLNALKRQREQKSVHSTLPDFKFIDINDKEQSLHQYQGRYILINIWSRSCKECLYHQKEFYNTAKQYKDNNITFIAISTDPQVESWKALQPPNEHVVNWRSDAGHPMYDYFVLTILPRYILISPDGNIINDHVPAPTTEAFAVMLSELFSK